MTEKTPPLAGSICPTCPNPDIVAVRNVRFGTATWDFECHQAIEVYVQDSGISIKCSTLDGPCCVENGRDVFVNSPTVDPLRSFFDTTLKYLGIKT